MESEERGVSGLFYDHLASEHRQEIVADLVADVLPDARFPSDPVPN